MKSQQLENFYKKLAITDEEAAEYSELQNRILQLLPEKGEIVKTFRDPRSGEIDYVCIVGDVLVFTDAAAQQLNVGSSQNLDELLSVLTKLEVL
jgi:hypothetical protein